MLCLHLGYIIIYPAYTWSAIVSFSWNFSCIVHCVGFGQLKFSTCSSHQSLRWRRWMYTRVIWIHNIVLCWRFLFSVVM